VLGTGASAFCLELQAVVEGAVSLVAGRRADARTSGSGPAGCAMEWGPQPGEDGTVVASVGQRRAGGKKLKKKRAFHDLPC
jgi:hypothetical protein